MVDLDGCGHANSILKAAAAANGFIHHQIETVRRQGVEGIDNGFDAIAALLLEKGDLQDAMLRAFTYAGKRSGTMVKIWLDKCPNMPQVGGCAGFRV